MIVSAAGHQVCCVLWEQMAIFNKGIGFSSGLKVLCIEYILWRILTTKYMFEIGIMLKEINCQRCANKYLWTSKHIGLFIQYILGQAVHPISSGKLQALSSSPYIQ